MIYNREKYLPMVLAANIGLWFLGLLALAIATLSGCVGVDEPGVTLAPAAPTEAAPLPAPTQTTATPQASTQWTELPEYDPPSGDLFAAPATCDPQTGCDAGPPDGVEILPEPAPAQPPMIITDTQSIRPFQVIDPPQIFRVKDLVDGAEVDIKFHEGEIFLLPITIRPSTIDS